MYRQLDHLLTFLDDLTKFLARYPLFTALVIVTLVVLCALVIVGY